MSSSSPQSAAAGKQAESQAALAERLSNITMPELQQLMGSGGLGGMLSGRDASGMMGPDALIKSSALGQLNQSYGQAQRGSQEAIQYGALRSGLGRTDPGAVGGAIGSAATSLDRDRQSALRNLDFMSAQSSMGDYNQVLSLLGQGSRSALSMGQGFSGAAGSAIGGMSGQSQMAGVLGGAASGAALGSSISPGWGTLIGGVVGGVAGGVTSP